MRLYIFTSTAYEQQTKSKTDQVNLYIKTLSNVFDTVFFIICTLFDGK